MNLWIRLITPCTGSHKVKETRFHHFYLFLMGWWPVAIRLYAMKVNKLKQQTRGLRKIPIRKDKNEREQKWDDMVKEVITCKTLLLCYNVLVSMFIAFITLELAPLWFIANWFILIPVFSLFPCYYFYDLIKLIKLIKKKKLLGKQTLDVQRSTTRKLRKAK